MVDFTITALADRPDMSDICAAWSFSEWGCHIPGLTFDEVRQNYRDRAQYKDRLPLVGVGLVDGVPGGMISLKENDHPDRADLKPWVGSLFVHRRFQRTGLALAMYEWLEKQAKDIFDFKTLYTFTCRSTKAYESLGWKKIGVVRDTTGFHAEGEPLLAKAL
jgi:GNAT superfamily N-acetyltransferase